MKKQFVSALALTLAACSGGQEENNETAAVNNNDTTASAAQEGPASPETATSAQPNCAVLPKPRGDAILGVEVGMSPEQVTDILACRGYAMTFPSMDPSQRQRSLDRQQREERDGYFRRDFRLKDSPDVVRILAEGTPAKQQVYYIGRATQFGENPPTLEAVGNQFLTAYRIEGGLTRDRFGNIEVGRIDPSANPVKPRGSGGLARHCSDLAFLHDPGDGFSPVMNRAVYPDPDCGRSLTLQVIQNGRNEALAYIARYRMADPQLALRLREERQAAAQAAHDAELQRQTDEAAKSGDLPQL